jgi:methylphosphotriester-DNA--protein-cysteine methyltransferase
MEYAELLPPPPLDEIVRCFWFLRGDLDAGAAEPQTIVPDGRLEFVLHLADPFARVDGSGQAHTQGAVLVSGQLTTSIRLVARGRTDIVGIRFRTAAASSVLRVPPGELTDHVVSLGDISRPLASALYDSAAQHDGPEARAAALSATLLRFVRHGADHLASAAVRALDATDPPRIDTIARTLGVSTRTLERRLSAHAGLPPSMLRRVIRFRRTFSVLDNASPGTWAKIAIGAGFFDQAHLIRDFRQFAGAAPSEFFRDRIDLARAILGSGERSAGEFE